MVWLLVGAACVMELGWIMVGAASPRLTESPQFTDAMFGALPPIWAWADALRRTTTPESAVKLFFVTGLMLTCIGFVSGAAALLRAGASRPAVPVAVGVVVFGVTLVLSPGLLSTDAVMYAVYGRMAAVYGLSPYLSAPSNIAGDQLLDWASRTPSYAAVASPYGPIWTWLSAGLAAVTQQAGPLAQVLPYRLVGLLSHGVNAYLVWCLARRLAPDTSLWVAVFVYAWNPLVLFEVVSGGHNDGIMLSLILGGLLVASSERSRLLGAVLVWAAALVKWVPAVVLLYLVSSAIAVVQGWTARAKQVLLLGGVLLVLTAALFGPWLDVGSLGALRASISSGGDRYVNAPLDVPTAWLAAHIVDRGGNDVSAAQALVREWTFGAARLLLLAYLSAEAIRLWRTRANLHAVVEASVRTLLLTLILGATQLLTWYLTWPVALAAPLGGHNRLTQLAVAYSILYLPIFYAIHEDMLPTTVASAFVVTFAIVPILVIGLLGRRRPAPGRLVEGVAA